MIGDGEKRALLANRVVASGDPGRPEKQATFLTINPQFIS